MPYQETDQLEYFTFETLQNEKLVQGVYTRRGGVSPAPWATLNLGSTVGDTTDNIIENRKRIFDTAGRPVNSLYDAWQVHGTHVICVENPRPQGRPHEKGDAILTNQRHVTLLMRFADCVPIFLFDPIEQVIGLVHAGWRGTVDGIAAIAVEQMVAHYHCARENIQSGIGPSICCDHYPVGDEVKSAVDQAFGKDSGNLVWNRNGSYHFDLWKANQVMLERAGVRTVEQSGICTVCHNDDWFSHRAEQGKTGRFAALLGLK